MLTNNTVYLQPYSRYPTKRARDGSFAGKSIKLRSDQVTNFTAQFHHQRLGRCPQTTHWISRTQVSYIYCYCGLLMI